MPITNVRDNENNRWNKKTKSKASLKQKNVFLVEKIRDFK